MEINRQNIQEIIFKSRLNPDKDYGQNFLLEPTICQKIVDALELKNGEEVLEIGPGIGSLTHFLSLVDGVKTTVVDIDVRMINFLKIIYQNSNIEIVENDIRKHDVRNYDKILGNLPYNITTETVNFLLLNARKCQRMVLMCQLEAFNHFFDITGKEYGPSSILVHLLGNIKKLFVVKAGSFYPVPKCQSVVFSIDINPTLDIHVIKKIYALSKQLFLNRRKTIYNNLSHFLNDKETATKVLNSLNIPLNKRPEEILPEQYVKIYLELVKDEKGPQ